MPQYKFFEPKPESAKKQVVFKEFKLATSQRQHKPRNNSQESHEPTFHAQPMPTFEKPEKPRTCAKRELTKAIPFELSTLARGEDKHSRL